MESISGMTVPEATVTQSGRHPARSLRQLVGNIGTSKICVPILALSRHLIPRNKYCNRTDTADLPFAAPSFRRPV